MRQVSTLFLLAGYPGDVDRAIATIRSLNGMGDTADAIGRSYPANPSRQKNYLRDITERLRDYIFTPKPSTGFCRRFDQPCSSDTGKGRNKTCSGHAESAACFRARPRMIAIITHPDLWDEVFDRLGRATVMLRYDAADLSDTASLKAFVQSAKPTIKSISDFLYSMPKNILTPLLPLDNFQKIMGHAVSADAQSDPKSFAATMTRYHSILHNPRFKNARKPHMRGGYRLNDTVAFQRDTLHSAAHVGIESWKDAFHIINAHHLYGAHHTIGMHFDVSADHGGSIRITFTDVLTGAHSNDRSTHENISPCDRVL